MKKITIEQLQKIADYLVTKPYMEVAGLLQMLGTLEDIKDEKTKNNN